MDNGQLTRLPSAYFRARVTAPAPCNTSAKNLQGVPTHYDIIHGRICKTEPRPLNLKHERYIRADETR